MAASSLGNLGCELPPVSLYSVCVSMQEKLDAFLAGERESPLLRSVQARLRGSLDLVEQSLTTYRLDQLAISWNGGKDCLVLLVILLASIARYFPPTTPIPDKIQALYIVPTDPFPEVDAFVTSASSIYHLDTSRLALPMKAGLGLFLKQNSGVEAMFVGTRRTDPHCANLDHVQPTDSGWPYIVRLHPVLEWRLAEIWTFIRHLRIPYCPLYDQGFTSLGGMLDTIPNPRLRAPDGNPVRFRRIIAIQSVGPFRHFKKRK